MTKADAGSIVPPTLVEAPKPAAKGAVGAPAPTPNLAAATKLANDMIGPGKDKFRGLLGGAEKLRKAKAVDSAANVAQINKLFSTATLVSIGVFVLALLIAAIETAPEFSLLDAALDRLRVAQSGLLDRLRNKAASPF